MAKERLQKILAKAGVASRRAAEKYILEGRVRVNGIILNELGSQADLETDRIEIQGYGVLKAEPLAYLILHKPPFVVSTVSDPEGRTTVMDVLQKTRAAGKRQFEGQLPRVFPVGRLDFDAEGIILLTNDGDLTNKLLHPKYHAPKTYMVKVKGRPTEKALERLEKGVRLKELDGTYSKPTAAAEVRVIKNSPANTWLEITVIEGRNHLIKRMLEAVRFPVLRLIRTDFAGVGVDDLPQGAWRFLTNQEIAILKRWSTQEKIDSKPTRGYRLKDVGEAPKTKRRSSGPVSKREVRQGTRTVSGNPKRNAQRSHHSSKNR